MALDAITRACAAHLRTLDLQAYLGCLFSDPRDQPPLFALHSLHAELGRIRESVSEPMLGEIRLTWWREALEEAVNGQVREHPVVAALAPHIDNERIAVHDLLGMIDARQQDLYEDGPRDREAVTHYARQTGGGLYHAAMAVSGADAAMCEQARALGTAATSLGIVRSVGFHAQMRRTHIPEDALADMGLDSNTLYQGQFSNELKAYLAAEGRACLALLVDGLKATDDMRQRQVLAPLVVAVLQGRLAERVSFDPETVRPTVSVPASIARTWLFVRLGYL